MIFNGLLGHADMRFEKRLLRKEQNQSTDKKLLNHEKECDDPHKLMPSCERIIPGLVVNKKTGKYQFSKETAGIRKTLFEIAAQRNMPGSCQVYKYLTTRTLRSRQQYAGKILDTIKPRRILDIGPYTNPVISFMTHCPESVYMVEPCGELSHSGDTAWSSKEVSCGASKIIEHVIPQKINTFLHGSYVENFDAIVCIGCDKYYGPRWEEIMSLPRPFHFILEYPNAYEFPIGNMAGCVKVESKEYDFSACPDCGFDDARVNAMIGKYAKFRKFFVFHCT